MNRMQAGEREFLKDYLIRTAGAGINPTYSDTLRMMKEQFGRRRLSLIELIEIKKELGQTVYFSVSPANA